MPPLITCTELAFGYENHIVAEHINLTVYPGDYLCIVGDNGSGKSTFIKGLLGLIKPMHGELEIASDMLMSSIGYVPQQSDISQDFPATVYEVVLSGCLRRTGMRPFFTGKEKKITLNNMEKLHISQLKRHPYSSLSGGQKQRVLIARALCATDKLLILDEPVNGLDPAARQELYQLIKTLNKELHTAVIMVSHDIQNAVTQSDKILHLNKTPLFFGSVADYEKSPLFSNYLGGCKHD